MPTPPLPPRFARIAVLRGHLQTPQMLRLLEEPLDTLQDDGSLDLAMRCLKRGILSPVQVRDILLEQQYEDLRREDKELGTLLVQAGVVDGQIVRFALDEQANDYAIERRLPRRLEQILIEAEAVTPEEFDRLRRGAFAERISTRVGAPTLSSAAAPRIPKGPRRLVPPALLYGRLIVLLGEGTGRLIPLDAKNLIGRNPDVQVYLPDADVSRHHAMLEFDPTTYQAVIVDLGSRNGTRVEGRPVEGPVELKTGARVLIGKVLLRFEQVSMAAMQARQEKRPPTKA